MKLKSLSDTEIIRIIDKEISESRLEPTCYAEAKEESKGNYDLMISRYFLKRVEMLKIQQVVKMDRAEALDARKRAAATQLVRYKSRHNETKELKQKKKTRALQRDLIGNVILIVSSISALSALLILQGYTVYSMSYLFITSMVVLFIVLPYLLSNVVFRKIHVAYQSSLALMCIVMCLGSVACGILVMKQNPPNYYDERIAEAILENEASEEEGVVLVPVTSSATMATNP